MDRPTTIDRGVECRHTVPSLTMWTHARRRGVARACRYYGTIASYTDVRPGSMVEINLRGRGVGGGVGGGGDANNGGVDVRVTPHESAHETVEIEVRGCVDGGWDATRRNGMGGWDMCEARGTG